MSTLNERDMGVLAELEAACRNHAKYGYLDGWARPLDCGGSNGSDHLLIICIFNISKSHAHNCIFICFNCTIFYIFQICIYVL